MPRPGDEAFIYSDANGLVDIGSLGGPGFGAGINDAGQWRGIRT
jgi:hypothetical protein